MNKAIAGFLAASTANEVNEDNETRARQFWLRTPILASNSAQFQIDSGREFDGKWPMTVLYSIYYEFSKRYPHSRITAMKQETTCSKTELVLRMLNYTLEANTFRNGLRNLLRKE